MYFDPIPFVRKRSRVAVDKPQRLASYLVKVRGGDHGEHLAVNGNPRAPCFGKVASSATVLALHG